MSATMRIADFTANTRLFPRTPPVVNIETRRYPINIHFNRETPTTNYVDEAFKKVVKIHERLPKGGILVFLTGQEEIRSLCRKLRDRFAPTADLTSKSDLQGPRVRCSAQNMDLEAEDIDVGLEEPTDVDLTAGVDTFDESEIEDTQHSEDLDSSLTEPLHVLPLYSLLAVKDQLKVFAPPPEGTRLCVVATNVAETSLTIPGIKYVVDCGLVKERVYDRRAGIESFQIQWISKASAAQRAGRAGRTGPGHCYRLYSSAVFERDFPQFSDPEILKYPIEGINHDILVS
jgi:ATP-dependent RNA helicase DHX37/DHR1